MIEMIVDDHRDWQFPQIDLKENNRFEGFSFEFTKDNVNIRFEDNSPWHNLTAVAHVTAQIDVPFSVFEDIIKKMKEV